MPFAIYGYFHSDMAANTQLIGSKAPIFRIALAGSGNLAWVLGQAFVAAGHEIRYVYSRNQREGKKLARLLGSVYTPSTDFSSDDLHFCFVLVSDPFIKNLSKDICLGHETTLVHCAGAEDLDVLGERTMRGVFYPLYSFRKELREDIRRAPILIESQTKKVYDNLKTLASTLQCKTYRVSSSDRLVYHLAAVFANNFSNACFDASYRVLGKSKLDFSLLQPIIAQTAERVQYAKPSSVQTGPAVRNDKRTQRKHQQLLIQEADLKRLYTAISGYIAKRNYT